MGRTYRKFGRKTLSRSDESAFARNCRCSIQPHQQKFAALADDVEDISKSMEEILKNQSQYIPRYLPSPRNEQIPLGKAYLHFNKRTLGNLPPDVMEELYLVSNIEDVIVAVTAEDYFDKFSDVTVASVKDYVISMNYNPKKDFLDVPMEFLDDLDYQTQSSWYKAIQETGKVYFTMPHVLEGNFFCTAARLIMTLKEILRAV